MGGRGRGRCATLRTRSANPLTAAMADEADLQFESADAGASTTFPMQAGNIRKNGHIVIKNRPCKVRGAVDAPPFPHAHPSPH